MKMSTRHEAAFRIVEQYFQDAGYIDKHEKTDGKTHHVLKPVVRPATSSLPPYEEMFILVGTLGILRITLGTSLTYWLDCSMNSTMCLRRNMPYQALQDLFNKEYLIRVCDVHDIPIFGFNLVEHIDRASGDNYYDLKLLLKHRIVTKDRILNALVSTTNKHLDSLNIKGKCKITHPTYHGVIFGS